MQLHTIRPHHTPKSKKPRVGRGGKRGTYSGKGGKGQKGRAGSRMRPAERDLMQRLPKLRGVKNRSIFDKPEILNLNEMEKLAKDGAISEKILGKKVKILGGGEVKKAINVEGLAVSKSAKEKIEAAGGHVK